MADSSRETPLLSQAVPISCGRQRIQEEHESHVRRLVASALEESRWGWGGSLLSEGVPEASRELCSEPLKEWPEPDLWGRGACLCTWGGDDRSTSLFSQVAAVRRALEVASTGLAGSFLSGEHAQE